MRGGDFPCVVMMNLFAGKLLLGIKRKQFTLQAKENNLILTEQKCNFILLKIILLELPEGICIYKPLRLKLYQG